MIPEFRNLLFASVYPKVDYALLVAAGTRKESTATSATTRARGYHVINAALMLTARSLAEAGRAAAAGPGG